MISHVPPSLKATPLHTGVPPLRGTSLTASAGICFWAVRHALRSCFLLSPCQSHRRPLFCLGIDPLLCICIPDY
ncbi:Synaptojanin-2 [Manis pentadactyla]|nr:Synaptojanin-2 [Manis pentadactyla]